MPFGGRISHSPGGYQNFSFEESELMIPELERDEYLIAATSHVVRATRDANKITAGVDTQLHSMTKATNDDEEKEEEEENEEMEEDGVSAFQDSLDAIEELERDANKIMAGLAIQLESMTKATEEEEEVEEDGVRAFQDKLNAIEEVILRWEEDQSMVWDSEPEEASDYVDAANEARRLIEKLEALHLSKEDQEYKFLHRAYNILQTAMARLEEEFRNLLIQDRRPSEYVSSTSRSNEEEYTAYGSPAVSLGDNSVESLQREEEHILHLTNPNVIPDLRCIANLMFACNYGQECSRAYTIVRRDALDESLFILEMDRLSVENVLRMEWSTLNSKIKRWIWAVKIFVKVYLASEKWLSDQIFGEGEPTSLVCFVDASKVSILKLLDFSVVMSIGPRRPEKLLDFLDMYEVLASLMPDIDALYSDDIGSWVIIECHEVLRRLGESVKTMFHEFEHAIASDVSQSPLGGEVHSLTKHVMDYAKALTDYSKTLNLLLKDKEEDDAVLRSPDMNSSTEEDIRSQVSPMAYRFQKVASILECKLDDMSKKFYKDASLQHLFLMNNIHHMAEMVKGSELTLIYGDKWIRKCKWECQQHATKFARTGFSSILSLLKCEGLNVPGTNSISKSMVKERLRSFYHVFGDLYRVQTGWHVPDAQLREELRIFISLKLIQAYRSFVGMHRSVISEKHIKYSAGDLENYLLDFFEGSCKIIGKSQ